MGNLKNWRQNSSVKMILFFLKWLLLSLMLGVIVGFISGVFLLSLEWVTAKRVDMPFLLYLLPIGGAFISFLYLYYGKNALRGNNLVIEQANGGREKIPLRLIPLTLIGTLVTHLFGGSAGREGTAVQMGGSAADNLGRLFHLKREDQRLLIICGMCAGFSSVFGTPLAGTLFGLEVLMMGVIRHEALFPSFFAAFFANRVTLMMGVVHKHYQMGSAPELSFLLVLKLVFAGILFGLCGRLFTQAIIGVKTFYAARFSSPVLRTFVGGLVIVLLATVMQTRDYLGLSLPLLNQAFSGTAHLFAFLWKLIYTALTLGAGYQGGEVTPLFDIGATLGSSLALPLGLPVAFLAGLGFVAVFTGATNTPLTCFVMGIELFGSQNAVYLFLICVVAYLCSGNRSIYSSQQLTLKKGEIQKMNHAQK